MRGVIHPFSKALYEQDGEGHVLVTGGERSGLFEIDGSWISGDIKEADPHLCGWVGGPQVARHESRAT